MYDEKKTIYYYYIMMITNNIMMKEKMNQSRAKKGKEYRGPTRLVGSFRANFSIQD